MALPRLAARAVGAVFACAACLADEPVVVRPRDAHAIFERLTRHIDWRDGLPASYLSTVVQDRDGFLWVTGPAGVARFDGRSFTTVFREGGSMISGCRENERIVFGTAAAGLREVEGTRVVDLHAPQPNAIEPDWGGAVAADGGVWWKQGNRFWRRGSGGAWSEVPSPAPENEPIRTLSGGRGPGVYVASRSTLWRLGPDGRADEIVRLRGIFQVVERKDGALLIGTNQLPGPVTTRVFEVRDGTARLVFERVGAKFGGLAVRGSRIWISTDAGLYGIGGGASPIYIPTSETAYAAGDVLIDREGSLWMATFRGLIQIPEPETYAASVAGGGKVARTIARVGKRTWLSTWGEMSRWEDGREGIEMQSFGVNFGIVCADADGHVWAQGPGGLSRFGETELIPAGGDAAQGPLLACSLGPSGTMWLSMEAPQLLVVPRGADAPRDVHASFPEGLTWFNAIREDAQGTLWILSEREVCRTSARALLDGAKQPWSCETLDIPGQTYDFASMPSGDLWLASSSGVVRRTNDRWEVLKANAALQSRWVLSIRPSPAGGVWLSTMGGLTRVVERPGTSEGFEIVERLSAWHGVPTLNATDVVEDADGTLWFATDAGLLKVPASVRHERPKPPPVALIEALADGQPLAGAGPIDLPYRRNRLELRFAALSFRDPTAIRYRHRMRSEDAWSDPSPEPVFRFVDLAPGRYRVEVEASLDGAAWSEARATFAFRVLKPWYLQPVFFAASLAVTGLGLTLFYRTRVRTLLHLERQRTRIAMDLHDEVGSGLGTISVLAGLVAKQDLEAERRHEFAGRIASVSRELSQALGDIVWSLRPGSGTLDAAWNQIVDRARPLFASGSPVLTVDAPESVPPLPLSVVARRDLFLIAVEALHNAARHSGATSVTLGLAGSGKDWLLTVEDDGRGIASSPTPTSGRRGLGLDGMRARASEMGASIAWDRGGSEGTRVTLRFRPNAD